MLAPVCSVEKEKSETLRAGSSSGPALFHLRTAMHSTKGFLQPGPNGARLTSDQIDGVRSAALQAIARMAREARTELLQSTAALGVHLIEAALRGYPADRSCHTCDFYVGEGTGAHYCRSWQSEIPKTHVEGGCSRHQTHGAPF